MNLTVDPRMSRYWRQVPPQSPYQIVEALMIGLLAIICARLIWTAVAPVGPVGHWTSPGSTGVRGDETLLTRFDPFFRLDGNSGPAVVTSLAIKVFGVRVDEATGHGSAIIATPDGVQNSYAVGDEITPGVRLKSVTFDGIMIDRGGVAEQVFLDQSVDAPTVTPVTAAVAPAPAPTAPPTSLANEIAFAPRRTTRGLVSGVTLSPKGSGAAFRAAGLQDGDVLTAINGQMISRADDVARAMAAAPQSGTTMLSIERSGKAMSLSVQAKQ